MTAGAPLLAQRLVLLLLAAAGLGAALAPLGHEAGRLPTPDLVFCLACAWRVRRPAAASLPVVLVLGLLGDILLARPPGLGALGLVLAADALGRHRGGFLGEWLLAAGLFGLVLGGTALLLGLTLAPLPGLAALGGHWLATALAYPLVAWLLRFLLLGEARK